MQLTPPDAAILARVRRGSAEEAIVRGHVAVVDATGTILQTIGDADSLTTLRSAIKPVQAMAFARVCDALACTDADMAVACGSHDAEPVHVETVRALLSRVGLDESDLACGPQLPYNDLAAAERLLSGAPLRSIDNNCSGKHAAMLAACVANGWPTTGYVETGHPLQVAVDADLGRLSGCDIGAAPWGIDGCGLPTRSLPLAGLARAFAAGQADADFRACQDAVAARPVLIGGTDRFDTLLMAALGARLTAKSGAYAVWAAALRPDGPGIAIKLESGWSQHLPVIAMAVLKRLGVLPDPLPEALDVITRGAVLNRTGAVVGEVAVSLPDWV